jgi:hypothetical protein
MTLRSAIMTAHGRIAVKRVVTRTRPRKSQDFRMHRPARCPSSSDGVVGLSHPLPTLAVCAVPSSDPVPGSMGGEESQKGRSALPGLQQRKCPQLVHNCGTAPGD